MGDRTLDGWIDRYVDFLRMRHYSEQTIATYRRSLRSLSAGLAARGVPGKAVVPADVTTGALYDRLAAISEERHLSPRTLNRIVCSVLLVLSLSRRAGRGRREPGRPDRAAESRENRR